MQKEKISRIQKIPRIHKNKIKKDKKKETRKSKR